MTAISGGRKQECQNALQLENGPLKGMQGTERHFLFILVHVSMCVYETDSE